MMNLFAFFVAISCLCGVAFSQGFWWPGGGSIGQRDCKWMKWKNVADGACEQIDKAKYPMCSFAFGIMKNRDKIPAKNGGKDCTGPSVKCVECDDVQYVGSRFLGEFGRRSGTASGGGSGQRSFATILSNPCTPDFKGADGSVLMKGKCETRKRRRRNAEGLNELVEVPLKEKRLRVRRQGPPQVLTTKHRDVLLLMDESGSIGNSNFKKRLLRMAAALASKFCGAISIGKETTRIGVMTFDSITHIHLNFDKYFEKGQVVNFINHTVPYTSRTGWSTCLIDALDKTRTDMITAARGARVHDPTNTERIVILFTDGCANCKKDSETPILLKKAREKFEALKIPFIVFFVGEKESCVKKMNGLSDGSRCYQVFRAKNWAAFDTMTKQIESQDCMDAWYIGQPCI